MVYNFVIGVRFILPLKTGGITNITKKSSTHPVITPTGRFAAFFEERIASWRATIISRTI